MDPEFVGDISQSLQGFLIRFVVVGHDFWIDLEQRQTEIISKSSVTGILRCNVQ